MKDFGQSTNVEDFGENAEQIEMMVKTQSMATCLRLKN